ncbi:hypothetical protein TNCV_18421 [Trichonephila clavipes]|nr:hypothetical protein TNCV_18421 [Trichonephila clavipes]
MLQFLLFIFPNWAASWQLSSSPFPLKEPPCRQRAVEISSPCQLNLSRAQTSVGVVVRRGGASSGFVHVMTMVQNYVVRR